MLNSTNSCIIKNEIYVYIVLSRFSNFIKLVLLFWYWLSFKVQTTQSLGFSFCTFFCLISAGSIIRIFNVWRRNSCILISPSLAISWYLGRSQVSFLKTSSIRIQSMSSSHTSSHIHWRCGTSWNLKLIIHDYQTMNYPNSSKR